MRKSFWQRERHIAVAVSVLTLIILGTGPSGHAEPPPQHLSAGTVARGSLTTPIYRGGAIPDEFLLKATPGNCGNRIQVTYIWSERQNWVRLRLKGKNVLEPRPSIERTEGVNFFTNPFWPEARSFDNGRYQFWTISSLGTMDFYYDGQTLDLLGSELDFANQPPDAIVLNLPIFAALPTPFFQPDENGDLDVTVEYEYNHLVRPDLPEFAHTVGTFIPHNLCKSNPFRYDLTSTRPYAVTVAADQAKTFREYLENGLIFDLTIEPPDYYTSPPLTTMAGVYNGSTAIAGGIPKGWSLDLEAAFGGLAPPIRTLPSAPFPGEACTDYFKPKRDRNFDMCQQPPSQGGNR